MDTMVDWEAIENSIAQAFDAGYKQGKADAMTWVSVEERLPEEKINPNTLDFEYVLCTTTFGDVMAYKFGTPIGWEEPHFWNGCGIYGVMDRYVTHWMPLPEPCNDLAKPNNAIFAVQNADEDEGLFAAKPIDYMHTPSVEEIIKGDGE